jgi:hypothetical protein
MSDRHRASLHARHGRIRAGLVSAACFLRSLPLFFRAVPRTPLRVFGIIALDTLHVLRTSRPLPRTRVRDLALLMDLQGCVNAAWDHKGLCGPDYRRIRQRLEQSGLEPCIEDYLGRLREIETWRPAIGGDLRRFDDVRLYRETVVRLAIATPASIALTGGRLEDAMRATECDVDVKTLFLILMQCQIIDDVIDYPDDRSRGLPSLLTATASLPQALELTRMAARSYAAAGGRSSGAAVWPLRAALSIFTTLTSLVVRIGQRRYRSERAWVPA